MNIYQRVILVFVTAANIYMLINPPMIEIISGVPVAPLRANYDIPASRGSGLTAAMEDK